MQYAIIRVGGKQYKVNKELVIEVDKITGDVDKNLIIDDVLMVVEDDKVSIGKPTVSGAKVIAKIVEQKKGDKIRVMKYKSKVRYRRTTGFRPLLSVLKIEDITIQSKTERKTTSKTTKK